LEVEQGLRNFTLTWEGSPTAVRFHVYRDVGMSAPREIAVVDATTAPGRYFVDRTVRFFDRYHYYVVAEDAEGRFSDPSNMVRAPFKGPVPTFKSLRTVLADWQAPTVFNYRLSRAQIAAIAGDYAGALAHLGHMRQRAADQTLLAPWRGEDLDVLLQKFIRRVTLARDGALPAWKLMW
jgi:hypothetical protein